MPRRGSGRLLVVAGEDPGVGTGTRLTYQVEVEQDLRFAGADIAAAVHARLTDDRGWQGIRKVVFERTDKPGADLRIIFATPMTTDELCKPLNTGGEYSCRVQDRVVLNAKRWTIGVAAYKEALEDYRSYMVNHEVGHALGIDHADCHEPGAPAPVMMQQTKGVGACRPNPWPATHAT